MDVVVVSSSSDEEYVNCPPPTPVEIIAISSGKAHLDVPTIIELLSDGDDTCEEHFRVACICVIGQQGSGKSFLANMILQNLIANGEGNWIGPVTKKQDRLEGFSWNCQDTEVVPSIKMMSRPFSLKKSNGERIHLLLMDCSAPPNDFHSQKLMETLALLLCPTVVVNQLLNIDLEFLSSYKKIFDQRKTPFYQRTYFTIRDYSSVNKMLSLGKVKEPKYNYYVEELLKSSSNRKELSSVWSCLQNKEVFAFPVPGKPTVVDTDGFLTLQNNFISQMKKFVDDILDVDDMASYEVSSKKEIIEYFQETIAWLNENSDFLLCLENLPSVNVDVPGTNENTALNNELQSPESDNLNNELYSLESNNLNDTHEDRPEHVKEATEKKFPSVINENFHQSCTDSKLDRYTKNVTFDQDKITVESQNDLSETLNQVGSVGKPLAEYLTCYNVNNKIPIDDALAMCQKEAREDETTSNFEKDAIPDGPKGININYQGIFDAVRNDVSLSEDIQPGNSSNFAKNDSHEPLVDGRSFEEINKLKNDEMESCFRKNVSLDIPLNQKCTVVETQKISDPIMEYPAKDERKSINQSEEIQHGNLSMMVECILPSRSPQKEVSEDLISFDESSSLENGTNESALQNESVLPNSQANPVNLAVEKLEQHIISEKQPKSENLLLSDSDNKTSSLNHNIAGGSTVNNPVNLAVEKLEQNILTEVHGPKPENLLLFDSAHKTSSGNRNYIGSATKDSQPERVHEEQQLANGTVDVAASCHENTGSKLPTSESKGVAEPTKSQAISSAMNIKKLSSEQKHELDQKFQDSIDKIIQSYMDSLNHFAKSERPVTKEKIQNKHSVLSKAAVEKLERVCIELKFAEDIKKEKIQILSNSLKLKHKQVFKEVNKSTKNGKSSKIKEGKKSAAPLKVLNQENTVPVSSAEDECSTTSTTTDTSPTDLAFTERANKLIGTYNHDIVNFIQIKGDDKTLLHNFHKTASEKLTNHFRDVFKGTNISDVESKFQLFQRQLDEVYSKYVAVPEEDIQEITLSAEEYQQNLTENTNQSLFMINSATKHLLNQYNSYMENCFKENGIRNACQLVAAHQKFLQNMTKPDFWGHFENKWNVLFNTPNCTDHFTNILSQSYFLFEKRFQIQHTVEEHRRNLIENTSQSISLMKTAEEYLLNQYDLYMENSFNVIRDVAQLNFAHQQFLQFINTPKFWSSCDKRLNSLFSANARSMTDHLHKVLSRRLFLYEQRFKNEARAKNFTSALMQCCVGMYKEKICDEVENRIQKTGFSSATQLVEDVHGEFSTKIIKHVYPEEENNNYGNDLVNQLKKNVKQAFQNVMKLDTVLKTYSKEMDCKFKKEICFSESILDDHHVAAKEISLNLPIVKVNNENFLKLSKIALDFAKCWSVNRNKEIQNFETEAAEMAVEIAKKFYKDEMNCVLKRKLYSSKHLTEEHEILKIQCVDALKGGIPFYCNIEKSGLKDFSNVLESEIDNMLGEYLKSNEKAMEDAVKKLGTITSGAGKNFKERMNGKLTEKSFGPLEFEKLFENAMEEVLNKTKCEIVEKIPTEGFELHLENIQNQMEMDVIEMRDENNARRNAELLKIRQEREEHLKNEATRGCTLPFLCIEFNVDTIQVGFALPNKEFTNLVDDLGKSSMENRISFLKDDEFIVGTVGEEKVKDISVTVSLEHLLDSSNDTSENKKCPKKIKFRGESLDINLELFCSLVFTMLKESAEKQAEEKFASAIISIPLWFASRHRQVIKATARIAGFEEVFLINDASAAALGYFKSKQQIGNDCNCLVVSTGKDSCNAAVYSYCEEKMKMLSSFGDRHIHTEKSRSQKLASFLSNFSPINFVTGHKDNIYSMVIKEIKLHKNVDHAAIFLTEDSDIFSHCGKAVESKEVKGIKVTIVPGDDLVLKGIYNYSRLLEKNIKSARESISELAQYAFVYTEDYNDISLPLVAKGVSNNWMSNTKRSFKTDGKKTLSFFEEASPLNRFHYGRAEFIAKKGESLEMKLRAPREGIYEVELSKKGILIDVDSYCLSDEDQSRYSAIIEKSFKKDPALEQLELAKNLLKEIAEDLKERFDQITVKTKMVRENYWKNILEAISSAENPSVDLETIELKIKTIEKLRETKFPKK